MQVAPQLRLFRQRHLLQRPTFRALRNAYRTIHVHATEHDHSSSRATEDGHQLFRLSAGADNQVDHHLGSKKFQRRSAGAELTTVALDLFHAGGRRVRAPLKHSDRVALLLERCHDVPPDKSVPTNKKYAHRFDLSPLMT